MPLRPVLRFWLPLGNMLLLVAVFETVNLVISGIKDVGILLYHKYIMNGPIINPIDSSPELIFLLVIISAKFIATVGLFIVGTILKGNMRCFLVWIIISAITILTFMVFFVVNTYSAVETYAMDTVHIFSMVYSSVIFLVVNAYILFITIAGYQAMGREEALHPIGKGAVYIWEYFNNETKIAATFFLASEIMLDSEYMLSKQFLQFFGLSLLGHEGDPYPPIVLEEIVLRIIRILTNSLGIWLVAKEKRRIFRWWCAFTFLLILVSTTIFVILTVQWRGENISLTLAYFLMFPGHLLYRFVSLYFCLKYTRADFSSFVL